MPRYELECRRCGGRAYSDMTWGPKPWVTAPYIHYEPPQDEHEVLPLLTDLPEPLRTAVRALIDAAEASKVRQYESDLS